MSSTGNSTCSFHRPDNVGSQSPIAYTPTRGTIITAAQIEDLRSKIANEINIWNRHSSYYGINVDGAIASSIGQGAYARATTLDSADENMKLIGGAGRQGPTPRANSSGYPGGATVPSGVADLEAYTNSSIPDPSIPFGSYINASHFNDVKANYEILRVDCICNADCSCNAVCACNGDCGCNYSDERLKREIIYC